MRVSKKLVYCDVAALTLNMLIIGLMVVKVFAPILGIALLIGFLASSVWLSCLVNGKLPKKARGYSFYSAPTKEVKSL